MAKVARSSNTTRNANKLVFHRQKVIFQTHPGKWNAKVKRCISGDIDFTLRLNGEFSQSGQFSSFDGAEVLVPGGCKAELDALGTKYRLSPITSLQAANSFLGVQQRLRSLGYLDREPNDVWDGDIERAILNFQADHQLSANGVLCDDTIEKLNQTFVE